MIIIHIYPRTFDEFLRPLAVFNHVLREFLIGRSALDRKLRTAAATDSKLVEITKTSQKLSRKIREIDLSYLCQQQFDNFLIWTLWSAFENRKRKWCKSAETYLIKKFVKPQVRNYFVAGFEPFRTCALCDWCSSEAEKKASRGCLTVCDKPLHSVLQQELEAVQLS